MKKQPWATKNLPKNCRWDKNGNWKGGIRKRKDGYIFIRIKETRSERLMHRVIMEEYLGRKLLRNEIIHHRNSNKSDNRIKNLQIMSQSEHAKLDYEKRQKNKLGQLL
jgi:hypothetical protein